MARRAYSGDGDPQATGTVQAKKRTKTPPTSAFTSGAVEGGLMRKTLKRRNAPTSNYTSPADLQLRNQAADEDWGNVAKKAMKIAGHSRKK